MSTYPWETQHKLQSPPSRRPMEQPRKKSLKAVGAVLPLVAMLALNACSATEQPEGDRDLTVGVSTIPTTLDPGQNASRTGVAILNLTSGTLTNLSSDGQTADMGLAQSVTADGNRYTVTLKPDLEFSDGSALTATDVVASFERYMADETNVNSYMFTPIAGVAAVDELTVAFDLKHPSSAFPFFLAYPTSAIIPSESIEAGGKDLYTGDALPTAGKYQVQAIDANQVTLQANPKYSGEQPSTETVIFRKISDPAARIAQLQGGQLDYADELSAKQLNGLAAPVEERTTPAANGLVILGMNNRPNSVLNDVRVRKAVAAAVDREQINQIAYAGKSGPLLSLFANSSRNNRPFLSSTADVESAKELLAGTECEKGCSLRFIAGSDDESIGDIALVVQQNLQAIGIEVSIEKAEMTVVRQNAKDGNYDLAAWAPYSEADIPDALLAYILGPTVGAIRTGYANPEMSQLLDRLQTTSGEESKTVVKQIDALFEEDLPFAPLVDYFYAGASRVSKDRFAVEATGFYGVK